ncbi:elongation factor-like GTPase 1 [Toxorhynchites rutilus septentrionalis]|uniref:elongation factor-like GTPase 1 n=1 Tax=Toxorhynchites rutilus septentrionalis TaxID=329112 RepID=UPI00247B1BE1|nr:elongation factor-like GTPase 1 [Toxorhynchites rutilus septentrionalis]
MVRVDLSLLVQLQALPERIRNICIIAHVDHGKTTLADSLIASNGIISQRLAGKLRYLDSRPDEQERQITMKSSSIALHHEGHLINLIDSPGHVDFSSEVSTAMRLCDGAIVVVDVVEGVCPQTRICLQQAYNENLETVLLLNKMDRLVLEKKMDTVEAYKHLVQVLEQVNAVVGNIFASDVLAREDLSSKDQISALEDTDDSRIYYAPSNGNVLFGSAIDGWGFTVKAFAKLYHEKLGVPLEQLEGAMWGDFFFSPKKKSIERGALDKGRKPLFVQLVLDNLWSIYDLVENRDVEKLKSVSEKLGVTQVPRDLKHADMRVPIKNLLSQWLPMERYLLDLVTNTVPNPKIIPNSKAERLLCSRMEDFKSFPEITQNLKQDILKCDLASENLIVFISKMFPVERKFLPPSMIPVDADRVDEEPFLAFARVYSGTLKQGDYVYVIGPKHDPRNLTTEGFSLETSPHISRVQLGPLFMLMGRELQAVESVPAGNIVGIAGLQNHVLKTATLSSTPYCPPFVDLPMIATPILRVAVEPKDIQKMPELLRGLKLLNQADACVQVCIQESGEHVLLTLGEVHLERCIKDLQDSYAKIELNVSKPIVPFKETIVKFVPTSEENPEEEIAKEKEREKTVTIHTPNRQSCIKLLALPLPSEVVELLECNHQILKALSKAQEAKEISHNLQESLDELRSNLSRMFSESESEELDSSSVDKIWSFGPKKCGTNILLNYTSFKHHSVWCSRRPEETTKDIRHNFESSFVNGFQLATLAGPLCDEPMQGVCFIILQWDVFQLLEEGELSAVVSHGPLSGQIMSIVKEGCKKAFQNQPQRLVHPMYSCNITVSSDVLGKLYAVIGRRHGRILSADLIEGSGQFDVSAVIPVIESFNFATELRKQTSGLAMPQLVFSHWEIVNIDPHWVPTTEEEYEQYGEKADFTNLAKVYMDSIRERKGLAVEKKTVEHAEKQRTLSKNK